VRRRRPPAPAPRTPQYPSFSLSLVERPRVACRVSSPCLVLVLRICRLKRCSKVVSARSPHHAHPPLPQLHNSRSSPSSQSPLALSRSCPFLLVTSPAARSAAPERRAMACACITQLSTVTMNPSLTRPGPGTRRTAGSCWSPCHVSCIKRFISTSRLPWRPSAALPPWLHSHQ
jgi:hypothetical protein